MKIASFNVNSLRARLGIVQPWLETHRPDVLAVQETKVQDEDFPLAPFKELDYHIAFKGQKSYNGVAVFSRTPFASIASGLDDEPHDHSRLLHVQVKGLHIVNTYVPQGFEPDSDKFQYKLAWFERLRQYFAHHFSPDDPVIWLGDLNVAPTDIDVHDPKRLLGHVCFCPEVSAAFNRIKDWGFEDLLRKHHSEPDLYTFWDYRGRGAVKNNRGWRIDHILATAPVANTSIDCTIDKEPRLQERPSDHTPIIVDLNW